MTATWRPLFILLLAVACAAPARAQLDGLASREELIDKLRANLEDYYARTYGAPLQQRNRLARLIAVASLSKIDATPITEKLLEAVQDKDAIVSQMAWDALHARHASLTGDQRKRWLDAGLATRERGGFPGATAFGLLSALVGYGQAVDGKIAADLIFDASMSEPNNRLANVVLQLYQTQSDRTWLRLLTTRSMRREADARRVDAILRKLPDAPPSPEKWSELAVAWSRYTGSSSGGPATQPLSSYTGGSEAFRRPEKIDDPEGSKWRKELELPQVPTERIELVYCIDSTASMDDVNQLLAATLQPLTMSLSLCANDVRAGVVYYRHETAKALQRPCCVKAAGNPKNHLVKTVPLSPNIPSIVATMKAFVIQKNVGHDRGAGAYAAALEAALKMNWSSPKDAQRVVVVIGDALPTEGSVEPAAQLAALMKERGIRLSFLEQSNATAKGIAPIAEAAGSTTRIFSKDLKMYKDYLAAGQTLSFDEAVASSIGQSVLDVIRTSVPPQYNDRIDLIYKATLPILRARLEKLQPPPARLEMVASHEPDDSPDATR